MIKRVITMSRGIESIGDAINNFISNHLRKNEYVIDIKYIKNGTRAKPYVEGRGVDFETVVIAIVHIGGINNELR